MPKLEDALKEAAESAGKDDKSFMSDCPGILTKLKRGISEVKKLPELLEQVPTDIDAWPFLLRVASEKASFAKQIWEICIVLLGSGAWARSFAAQERKERLSLVKATPRDAGLAAEVAARALATGAVAELGELVPTDAVGCMDPAACVAFLDQLQGQSLPASTVEAVLESEVGRCLAERGAAGPADGEAKRKVVAPDTKDSYGKGDNMPIFVCEGISGSHQKMEIKKGL